MGTSQYVRFFEDMGIEDVPIVGGKNASLGEMFQKLSGEGVRIPHGFAITAAGYRHMLDEAGAWGRLHAELDDIDPADVAALARKAKRAREIVYGAGLPDDLAAEIIDRLPPTSAGVRRGRQPGRTEFGHRRGPPDGELRRPAGFLPQHQGRREPARHLPPLFCKPLHRPCDPLPDRPGLRPLQGLAVDRRDEDGALRHLLVGRDVLPRHRVGLPRRRIRHGRLWSRREHRSGCRRPRRVLRAQADLCRRTSRGLAPLARRQGREDDPRRRRDEEHDAKHPDPEGRPRPVLPHRRRRPGTGGLRVCDRSALRQTDGHGVGQGRHRRQALHRPGPPGDGGLPAQRDRAGELRARRPRRGAHRGPLGRRADRLGRGQAHRKPHAACGIQAGSGAGRRHHHTRLGTGHEDRRRDRHQPRRAHLPRVDHRPRTRHPRRGGYRRRDHQRARRRRS